MACWRRGAGRTGGSGRRWMARRHGSSCAGARSLARRWLARRHGGARSGSGSLAGCWLACRLAGTDARVGHVAFWPRDGRLARSQPRSRTGRRAAALRSRTGPRRLEGPEQPRAVELGHAWRPASGWWNAAVERRLGLGTQGARAVGGW